VTYCYKQRCEYYDDLCGHNGSLNHTRTLKCERNLYADTDITHSAVDREEFSACDQVQYLQNVKLKNGCCSDIWVKFLFLMVTEYCIGHV